VHGQPPEGHRPVLRFGPEAEETIRRLCPVVGSWPDKDFTTKAAGILETELTAAGTPHDLKVHPGTKRAFFNDQLPKGYDAVAAADSWHRVVGCRFRWVSTLRVMGIRHDRPLERHFRPPCALCQHSRWSSGAVCRSPPLR